MVLVSGAYEKDPGFRVSMQVVSKLGRECFESAGYVDGLPSFQACCGEGLGNVWVTSRMMDFAELSHE